MSLDEISRICGGGDLGECLRRWDRGATPRLATLRRLAAATGLDLDDIVEAAAQTVGAARAAKGGQP